MSSNMKRTVTSHMREKTSLPSEPVCSYCDMPAAAKVIFSFGMIRFCSDHFLPFEPDQHFGEDGILCEPDIDMLDVTPVLGESL